GGWMDQVLLLDGPYIKDGFIQVTDKPGLGIELNPDVVRAHLAPGETWWGESRAPPPLRSRYFSTSATASARDGSRTPPTSSNLPADAHRSMFARAGCRAATPPDRASPLISSS